MNIFLRFAELFPQSSDMDVNRSGLDRDLDPPNGVEQTLAAKNLPFVFPQVMEQGKFLGGQFDRFSRDLDLMLVNIKLKIGGFEELGFYFASIPLDDRFDPGGQLTHAERLGQIIVGSQLQANDLVRLFSLGGQHYYWNVGSSGPPL